MKNMASGQAPTLILRALLILCRMMSLISKSRQKKHRHVVSLEDPQEAIGWLAKQLGKTTTELTQTKEKLTKKTNELIKIEEELTQKTKGELCVCVM